MPYAHTAASPSRSAAKRCARASQYTLGMYRSGAGLPLTLIGSRTHRPGKIGIRGTLVVIQINPAAPQLERKTVGESHCHWHDVDDRVTQVEWDDGCRIGSLRFRYAGEKRYHSKGEIAAESSGEIFRIEESSVGYDVLQQQAVEPA